MAGKSNRPKLTILPEELSRLQRLRQTPTAPLREVQRAQILTRYHAGETVAQIARNLRMTRKSVAKWIQRALAVGADALSRTPIIDPRLPASQRKRALGWCRWRAANPKISATPLKCGRAAHWLFMCEAMRWRRGTRPWPRPLKPRCSGFWPSNRFTLKGSSIIWSGEIHSRREDADGSHGIPSRRATE